MGRQDDNDATIVNSSIALLQERFRQLEKVKERREGKELLKLLSNSETQRGSSSMHNTSTTSSPQNSLQPRSVVPHRPTPLDSLSLGLNLNTKQGDHHQYTMKSSSSSSSSSSFWPQGASSSRNFDSSDVDTSLHL